MYGPENREYFLKRSLYETDLPSGVQTPVEFAKGIQHIPLESTTAPPFSTTNLTIINGESKSIIIDPGWNSKAENAESVLKNIPNDERKSC